MTEPSACAGWKKVTLSQDSVAYLQQNDPQALSEIVAHAEFGTAVGCFK